MSHTARSRSVSARTATLAALAAAVLALALGRRPQRLGRPLAVAVVVAAAAGTEPHVSKRRSA